MANDTLIPPAGDPDTPKRATLLQQSMYLSTLLTRAGGRDGAGLHLVGLELSDRAMLAICADTLLILDAEGAGAWAAQQRKNRAERARRGKKR